MKRFLFITLFLTLLTGCNSHSGGIGKKLSGDGDNSDLQKAPESDAGESDEPKAKIEADLDPHRFIIETHPDEIKIVSYNVHNLFDTEHDEGKQDWEFLPKNHELKSECAQVDARFRQKCFDTDWTEAKLNLKLEQIKKALSLQGPLPDILVLQEVENQNVVGRLAETLGYVNYYVSTSPDERGIDVAVLWLDKKINLYKHPGFEGFKEKVIDTSKIRYKVRQGDQEEWKTVGPTRNILGAYFCSKNPEEKWVLGVYANHWPSQGNVVEARLAAAKTLHEFYKEDSEQYSGDGFYSVATGDFNTVRDDSPNPIEGLQAKATHWMLDIHTTIRNHFHKEGLYSHFSRFRFPQGSYFYRNDDSWNLLDRFLISPNLHRSEESGLKVNLHSYRILAAAEITREFEDSYKRSFHAGNFHPRTPWGYNVNAENSEEAGFSDHFPIVMKIGGVR